MSRLTKDDVDTIRIHLQAFKEELCNQRRWNEAREYEELIDKLQSIHQWIPCSERLPKYGIEVLTFNRDGEYEVNHVIDEEDGEWFLYGVIAWMPLPEPYKRGMTE